MKNIKLTRAELHAGYIQQYVINGCRVELKLALTSKVFKYTVFSTRLNSGWVVDGENKLTLTEARKEFSMQVIKASKHGKETELEREWG